MVEFVQGFEHSTTQGADQIRLLRDANGDGKADVKSVFLDNLV